MTTYNGTAGRVLAALKAYDLKAEQQAGSYRSNSPLRPGSNSHGFSLTIHDDENGAYKDHVSSESGSLYKLADALGIATGPGGNASDSSKGRAYDSLADYAGERYEAAFIAAGWSHDVQQVYDNKERGKRPALVFQNSNGRRARFVDGLKPSYKPLPKENTAPCWYGLRRAVQMGGDLVLCNGESSCITAQAHDVPAICISGSGEGNLSTHLHKHGLLDELLTAYPTGCITVALDCDQAGRKAAAAVVPLLASAGYDAQAIDLGGADGFDMRDFCRLHADDSPAALARCEPLPRGDQAGSDEQRPRFTLETLDDLAALPPTQWLIPERIPADSLTLLYGPSESGKSFIALHWALTVALRNPDRAVIYVAPEGGSGYARRAQAWLQHWKKDAPPNLRFIRAAPRLGDTADLRELIDTITPYQPIFVALDTLARCAVELDENSAKDMGLFIEACDKIRRATGAAVMPVHHSGKDARNGARGSSALRAAVDMAHEVQRDGELVTLACDKSKDIAKPDAIYLHMMEVAESVVLMPSDRIVTTRDSKLQKNERAALEALNLEVFENAGASARKLVEISQVPEGSLYRVLSKLLKRGYVTQHQKGDPYYISDTGRRAISDYQESINSGASWGPDDEPPDGAPPPRGGDRHDSDSDSSEPELSPEYGSTKPNYHTITGYDGAEVIEQPESDGIAASDYHQDTAPESPTITSITDYHPTIDSDTHSLSSHHGYIYDSRDGESAAEGAAAPTASEPPEPAPDLPEGWRLVKCDYRGGESSFGIYWKVVHTSGEASEPSQYADAAARAAWATARKVRHQRE
jgi:hypothetical protein